MLLENTKISSQISLSFHHLSFDKMACVDLPRLFEICAEERNYQEVLNAIEKGSVNGNTIYQGYSLLHIATANGKSVIVKALIDKGCNIHKKEPVCVNL